MLHKRSFTRAAAMLAIASTAIVPAAALASPPTGPAIGSEIFVTGTLEGDVQLNSDRVKFQTKEDTLVRVQKLTFPAGSATGWHHHPGVVFVTVASGTLNLAHSDCSSHNYGPGDAFTEGEARVHNASSPGGAVAYVTYVSSSIDPPVFRIEDPVPLCAQ